MSLFHLISPTVSAPRGREMIKRNPWELTAVFYSKKFLRDSLVCTIREIIGLLDYDIIESLLRKKKKVFLFLTFWQKSSQLCYWYFLMVHVASCPTIL